MRTTCAQMATVTAVAARCPSRIRGCSAGSGLGRAELRVGRAQRRQVVAERAAGGELDDAALRFEGCFQEELVDLIADSGGKWIFIGMESLDPANLPGYALRTSLRMLIALAFTPGLIPESRSESETRHFDAAGAVSSAQLVVEEQRGHRDERVLAVGAGEQQGRRNVAVDRGQRDHGYGGAGAGLSVGPSV